MVDKINCIDTTYVEKEVLDNLDTEKFAQLSDFSKLTFDELFDKFIFATNYKNRPVSYTKLKTFYFSQDGFYKRKIEDCYD